jgi:hypothetical protein
MMKPDAENDSSDASEPWQQWKRRDARERIRAMVREMEEAEAERQRQTVEEVNRRERIRRRKANEAFDPPCDDASLSHRLHLPYSGHIEEPGVRSLAVDGEQDDEPVVEDDGAPVTETSSAEVPDDRG